MDNLCHTLAGAALGEAGLKRKTPLAMATLLVGANLPDLDAAAYWWGKVTALGFRRGWTHGVLAMAVWPLVLAGLMLAFDRLVRRRRDPSAAPAAARALVLLAALAVWTHPLLDYLNTYGVRWLMPFSGRWYYGDTLFIVDPWVWLMLGAGVLASRWRERMARRHAHGPARTAGPRSAAPAGLCSPVRDFAPARLGLILTAVYVAAMGALTMASRRMAGATLPAEARLMIEPVPVLPMLRRYVVDHGDRYERGVVLLFPRPGVTPGMEVVEKGDRLPGVAAATETPDGRAFLGWARFPVFSAVRQGPVTAVTVGDARYPNQPWASVSIRVARPVSFVPPHTLEQP